MAPLPIIVSPEAQPARILTKPQPKKKGGKKLNIYAGLAKRRGLKTVVRPHPNTHSRRNIEKKIIKKVTMIGETGFEGTYDRYKKF